MEKRNFFRLTIPVILGIIIAVFVSGCSNDSSYPEKPIRLIVPYESGGQSDLTARKIAEIIKEKELLDQPVNVTNMEGGNTQNGLQEVKDSKPDGYTLLFHHTALLTLNSIGDMDMGYEDFTPLGQAMEMPFVILANKDAPWDNIEEVLDEAKENPKDISVAVAGEGGAGYYALMQFLNESNSASDFKLKSYGGGSEAASQQLGGHVDLRAANMGDSLEYINSDELKVLTSLTQEKNDRFPDVMTSKDVGVNNSFSLESGVLGPEGLPDDIKDEWNDVLKTVIESEEFQEFADEQGGTPEFNTGDDWEKQLAEDQKEIDKVTEEISNDQ